jgi:hypothetical protein
VPLLHLLPNKISQCVPVLQLCHCYFHCPTKYQFVPVLQLCHCSIQCPTQYHSVFPSFSFATVPSNAQHNITVCWRPSFVPLLHTVPAQYHSMFPSFICATVTFSAQQNITVSSRPSAVPLLHPVPNKISQCVAVLQLCHCYIQCPTEYHSVLQSLSCPTVKSSAQHNIRVCCRPSVVPLLHSVPNTIPKCVAVLQLSHCSIQCPTQYHSVFPSFSCATVISSTQKNITVGCRPSVLPLLHSVTK